MPKRSSVRAIRKEQGFERSPPRCANCVNYKQSQPSFPKQATYIPPMCKIGNFPVEPVSICNLWTSRTGETLEN